MLYVIKDSRVYLIIYYTQIAKFPKLLYNLVIYNKKFRLELIASSIMNKFESKDKRIEKRLLIFLCVFCFICGIPLCMRVNFYKL